MSVPVGVGRGVCPQVNTFEQLPMSDIRKGREGVGPMSDVWGDRRVGTMSQCIMGNGSPHGQND